MEQTVEVAKPAEEATITLEQLPMAPAKMRQWLMDVASRQDLYQKGRMVQLSDRMTVVVLKEGLRQLQKLEEQRAREQKNYLLNRFGTVMVGLDAAQPAEGDIIIVENAAGEREQCVVEGGSAWLWKQGRKGIKFCAVSRIVKWRACELDERPVQTTTADSDVEESVKAALAKGKQIAGDGSGLARKPGAGQAKSQAGVL